MSTKHSIALTAIAAALALSSGSAQAAVIGSFDPGFVSMFSGNGTPRPTNNLGYRGTIALDLSAGCAGATGRIFNNQSGCTITLDYVTIDYYNASVHPVPQPQDILVSTFLPAGAVYSQNASAFITDAYFDPTTGNLLAFGSNVSDNIYVSVTDNSAGYPISYNPNGYFGIYDDYLNLQFMSNFVPNPVIGLLAAAAAVGGPVGPRGTVAPTAVMNDTIVNNTNGFTNPYASLPARVTILSQNIAAVPEPESAALALIGLGALVAARRRKPTKRKCQTKVGLPSV